MRVPRFRSYVASAVVLTVASLGNHLLLGQQANQDPPDDSSKPFTIVSVASVNRSTLTPDGAASEPDRPSDVMAGDELRVKLSQAPVRELRYQVRFGASNGERQSSDPASAAWLTNSGELVSRIPSFGATGWTERLLYVERLADQPASPPADEPAKPRPSGNVSSGNAYPLRIAPPANASISEISPTTAEFDSTVKVTGQGFFAPPHEIDLRVGEIRAQVLRVSPTGEWFSALIPHRKPRAENQGSSDSEPAQDQSDQEDEGELFQSLFGNWYDAGTRSVSVSVWGVPAGREVTPGQNLRNPPPLRMTLQRPPDNEYTIELFAGTVAFLTAAAVLGLVYLLYRTLKRRRWLLSALLLEPETQTYSLSRAQFFWWLVVIVYGYLFVFFAHGIHQGNWSFPPLQGFAFTFLISLGTLVLAQATSAVRGSKGAGVVHPSAADLIVHGGVLAPERVQQVVWTVLTGLGFLWIVVKTHATAAGLPEIPTELLVLMGLSSAGYLGGKLARKPGPIIKRVEVGTGSVRLRIIGQHLSVNPRILIDSVELAGENVKTLEPDPDHPNEFVKALEVKVPENVAATQDEWFARTRVVILINADTQRAEWQLDLPTITSIRAGSDDGSGRRVVTILGEKIEAGAVLIVPGTGEEVPLTPAAGEPPTQWTATVSSWPTTQTDVTVKAGSGARVTQTWTPESTVEPGPPARPPAPPTPPAGPGPDAGTPDTPAPPSPPAPSPEAQVDAHLKEGDQSAEETGTSRTDPTG